MANASSISSSMQRFYVSGINGKNTGATLIFTPTSRFSPISVALEVVSTTGFILGSTCSVGTNASSYNDIMVATAMIGMSSNNNLLNMPISTVISSIAAGTGVYLNVSVGANATTYVIKATINGYYD